MQRFPIEIGISDDATPADCEDAIMLLHGVKNAQRTRAYNRALQNLTEYQRNFILDRSMDTFRMMWAGIEEDKRLAEAKQKFMAKCVLCDNNAGKYLYCESCESRRTIQKQFGVPNEDYNLKEHESKLPKETKESDKREAD